MTLRRVVCFLYAALGIIGVDCSPQDSSCHEEGVEVDLLQREFHVDRTDNSHSKKMGSPLSLSLSPPLSQTSSKEDQSKLSGISSLIPLYWMHVPKCGSSFMNTLLHTPGMCPSLPPNALMTETIAVGLLKHNGDEFQKEAPIAAFLSLYPLDIYCPDRFLDGDRPGHIKEFGAHLVLDFEHHYDRAGGIVTMLRKPSQRALSSYYYEMDKGWNRWWPYSEPPTGPEEYARVTRGCMVKQIARDPDSYLMKPPRGSSSNMYSEAAACDDDHPPTSAEKQLALARVKDFAFIGITDEWSMSICLWHAMFGGSCKDFELMDTRPTDSDSKTLTGYNETELGDFVDTDDESVFAEGLNIYESNLDRYDVTRNSCNACFGQE